MTEYMVLMPRIVGNPERGFATVHNSDLRRFTDIDRCIRHGMVDLDQSDDFLIAVLDGDTLKGVQYMRETPDDPDFYANLDRVADEFGWRR